MEIQPKAVADATPRKVESFRTEMTALEHPKWIHAFLRRIARELVPAYVREGA